MKLKAKTPKGAAMELKRYLIKKLGKEVEREIFVRGPDESILYSGSKCWTLSFEGGPYEWPIALTAGGDIFKWQHGAYSAKGDYENGVSNESVFVECQNHYQLNFYKNN